MKLCCDICHPRVSIFGIKQWWLITFLYTIFRISYKVNTYICLSLSIYNDCNYMFNHQSLWPKCLFSMYLDTLYPMHFYLPCTYFYGHIVITDDQVIQISEMGKMKLSCITYPTKFTHGLILHYLLYLYCSFWQIRGIWFSNLHNI